jgi:hypothetical protein
LIRLFLGQSTSSQTVSFLALCGCSESNLTTAV